MTEAENLLRKKIILLGQQSDVARNELSIVQMAIKAGNESLAELDKRITDDANEIHDIALEKKSLLEDLGDIRRASARQTAELIRTQAMNHDLLQKNEKLSADMIVKEKSVRDYRDFVKSLRTEKSFLEKEVSTLEVQVEKLSGITTRIQSRIDTLLKRYAELDESIPKRTKEGEQEVFLAKKDVIKSLEDREGDISFKENNLKEKEERLKGMIREAEKFYNRKFPNIFPNI